MTLDLDELERRAKEAQAERGVIPAEPWVDFVKVATPLTVLALIERVRELEKKLAEAPDNYENGDAFEKDINA